MKTCRSCRKEIEDGAKKCDKCGSYQTFSGRFINMGIPIISIVLAMVSWGQTYMENMDKKNAIADQIKAENKAMKAEERMQIAINEEESARNETMQYQEAFTLIDEEIKELKTMDLSTPRYREKLNVISHQLETTRQPVKVIDGQRYKRIE